MGWPGRAESTAPTCPTRGSLSCGPGAVAPSWPSGCASHVLTCPSTSLLLSRPHPGRQQAGEARTPSHTSAQVRNLYTHWPLDRPMSASRVERSRLSLLHKPRSARPTLDKWKKGTDHVVLLTSWSPHIGTAVKLPTTPCFSVRSGLPPQVPVRTNWSLQHSKQCQIRLNKETTPRQVTRYGRVQWMLEQGDGGRRYHTTSTAPTKGPGAGTHSHPEAWRLLCPVI